MTIVVVTNYFASHGGGVERVAEEIVRSLARSRNVRIEWFAADSDYCAPYLPGEVRCYAVPSSNCIERKLGLPFPIWGLSGFRRLAVAVRRCDVVHLHDCLYLPNVAAFLFARYYHKRVVVTQHIGNIPYDSVVLRGILQILNRSVGAYLLGHADQAVFISETVRKYFSRLAQFRRPPMLRANGVRIDRFHPIDLGRCRATKQALGFREDQQFILFVGRFVEKKGLPLVRALAEATPELQWVIVGWGPLRPEEWHLSNVCVLRGVAQDDLAAFYQSADLLVLPSKGEGFPLVIQEAMACGTPSLTNVDTLAAIPGIDRFLYGETLRGADVVDRWVKRIRGIIENQAPCRRVALAEYAAREWAWDQVAQDYEEIFSAMMTK